MKDYNSIVAAINNRLKMFNEFLREQYHVPYLSLSGPGELCDISTTPWDQQHWPNQSASGVYFIFGYKADNAADIGVYIGKASLNSKIGNRLYAHLSHQRNGIYSMKNAKGQQFNLEGVSSINFEIKKITALAPALEEYLICNLGNEVHLLNEKGNV
jgi:hypothetical protein